MKDKPEEEEEEKSKWQMALGKVSVFISPQNFIAFLQLIDHSKSMWIPLSLCLSVVGRKYYSSPASGIARLRSLEIQIQLQELTFGVHFQ